MKEKFKINIASSNDALVAGILIAAAVGLYVADKIFKVLPVEEFFFYAGLLVFCGAGYLIYRLAGKTLVVDEEAVKVKFLAVTELTIQYGEIKTIELIDLDGVNSKFRSYRDGTFVQDYIEKHFRGGTKILGELIPHSPSLDFCVDSYDEKTFLPGKIVSKTKLNGYMYVEMRDGRNHVLEALDSNKAFSLIKQKMDTA